MSTFVHRLDSDWKLYHLHTNNMWNYFSYSLYNTSRVCLFFRFYRPSCEYYYPEDPLKIVRGEGTYLFNEKGVKYLDCVNNVCHGKRLSIHSIYTEVEKSWFRRLLLFYTLTRSRTYFTLSSRANHDFLKSRGYSITTSHCVYVYLYALLCVMEHQFTWKP